MKAEAAATITSVTIIASLGFPRECSITFCPMKPTAPVRIIPWLMSSMDAVIQTLKHGGRLGWSYKGTPYEKVFNKDGITTEFIRCIDPATGLVAKIIRKKV